MRRQRSRRRRIFRLSRCWTGQRLPLFKSWPSRSFYVLLGLLVGGVLGLVYGLLKAIVNTIARNPAEPRALPGAGAQQAGGRPLRARATGDAIDARAGAAGYRDVIV